MRGLHILARVLARTTRGLAELLDQVRLELGEPGRVRDRGGEEAVDARVTVDPRHEIVDDGRDPLLAAETDVQRFLLGGRRATGQGDHRYGQRDDEHHHGGPETACERTHAFPPCGVGDPEFHPAAALLSLKKTCRDERLGISCAHATGPEAPRLPRAPGEPTAFPGTPQGFFASNPRRRAHRPRPAPRVRGATSTRRRPSCGSFDPGHFVSVANAFAGSSARAVRTRNRGAAPARGVLAPGPRAATRPNSLQNRGMSNRGATAAGGPCPRPGHHIRRVTNGSEIASRARHADQSCHPQYSRYSCGTTSATSSRSSERSSRKATSRSPASKSMR